MNEGATEPSDEVARQARHDQLREEAKDAGAYRAELLANGFEEGQVMEMIMHWQGHRWYTEGAP